MKMMHDPTRLALARYPWTTLLDTRYGDMDPNRHLNNVAISQLFEETRVRFNWVMIDGAQQGPRPSYLVAHVGIDFLGEGEYPGTLAMGYGVINIGRTSFRALMGMFQHDKCIALCESVLVHRGDTGPAPVPAPLRARLEAFSFPTGEP